MISLTIVVLFVAFVLLWSCLVSASKADDAVENYLNNQNNV